MERGRDREVSKQRKRNNEGEEVEEIWENLKKKVEESINKKRIRTRNRKTGEKEWVGCRVQKNKKTGEECVQKVEKG